MDEMCNQLPQREYERISQEIWQEEQLRKQEQEANRRFSVFHVTECGEEKYFQVEAPLEFLQTASKLRAYKILRSAYSSGAFAGSRISLWTMPRFSG